MKEIRPDHSEYLKKNKGMQDPRLELTRKSGRDRALFHAVQAKEMLTRARGDESSPFHTIGTDGLAMAHDEGRAFGISPARLDSDADEAIAKFDRIEAKVLRESFPDVVRGEPDYEEQAKTGDAPPLRDAGFPAPEQRRRGW